MQFDLTNTSIHTTPGYSQWILTRVIELVSALVHTATQHMNSTQLGIMPTHDNTHS